jgi:hypothetical protein
VTNLTPPVAEALPLFFKTGAAWAEGVLTCIPGDRETKKPLVSFKEYIRSAGRRLPSEKELRSFRLEGTEGANPLLLLESPYSDAYCICVIDVDHMPSMKAVGDWLIAKGVVAKGGAQPLVVTTGREGGGQHLYFLCEAENAHLYRSRNGALLFGTYVGSDGKPHGCVDFKAVGAYVVAPGARHKSGKVYKAWHCGQEVTRLSDVIAKLPVLPLEVWNEGRFGTADQQAQKRAAAEGTQWVIEGPEWAEVVGHADKELMVCPWCRKAGKNSALEGKTNLQWNADSGTAYCHREQRLYRLGRKAAPSDVPANWAALDSMEEEVDEEPEPAPGPRPPRSFKLDPVGWAVDSMNIILDEELGPKREDIGVLFPDDDPLKDWESQAHRAAALAERSGLLYRREACTRGPWAVMASGTTQTRERLPCQKWHCPECGKLRLESLRLATAATLQEQRRSTVLRTLREATQEGSRRSTVLKTLKEEGGPSRTVDRRSFSWNTIAYDSNGFEALAKKLKRWASKDEGRGWLAIRTQPGRVAVIAWGDEDDLACWPLAEGAEFGGLQEVCRDAVDCVDLEAWRAWRDAEKLSRIASGDDRDVKIEVLLAPSELKSKIATLCGFILGWERQGVSTARVLCGNGWAAKPKADLRPKGEDFSVIVTYAVRDLDKSMGDILQQQILPVETGPGRAKVELPCPAAPVQKAAIAATPSLHACKDKTRPARRSKSSPFDLLEN